VTHHEFQIVPSSPQDDDGIDQARLAQVMGEVPKGAMALAGGAVALLTIGWVLIYLLVFVPRGVVG
jgi:hypothetical protein